MEPDQALDSTYWRRQAADHPPPLSGCAETLAGLGVDVVIEIGRDAVLAPLLAEGLAEDGGRRSGANAVVEPAAVVGRRGGGDRTCRR